MTPRASEHERPAGPERRVQFAGGLRVERRAEAEGRPAGSDIVGHAAVFDQWTTLYEGRYWTWKEVIRPGAFTNALAEGQDVRCLFNHDSNFVLGRTASGTTTLEEDAVGLFQRTDAPDTQIVRDLVVSPIERKDITGMSFAFSPRDAGGDVKTTEKPDGTVVIEGRGQRVTLRREGERLVEEREVLDADLYDVSPVTYPAYKGTDVAMRSIGGVDLRSLIEEKDRPHARACPVRDEYRRWAEAAAAPAPAPAKP